MKGTGVSNPPKYKMGATRKPKEILVAVQDATDEVDAFYALKKIKQRAARERYELKKQQAKKNITLPKLKFMRKESP